MLLCLCVFEHAAELCLYVRLKSLILAQQIKETGCTHVPASSRPPISPLTGSRTELGPDDHIWPGALSPAAILPHCMLLSSFPIPSFLLLLLRLLIHNQNRALFIPLLVSLSAPYHSFPLLPSPAHPVTTLFCLFSPNPLPPLILLLPPRPCLLLPLFFPFSLLPEFPFSVLSFPSRKLRAPRFTPVAVHRERGSFGPWSILTSSLSS